MRSQGKGFGGNIFAMSPGGAVGSHLLRVDPLGKVHYDGASEGSEGEDSDSDDAYDGEDGNAPPGGALARRRLSSGGELSSLGGGEDAAFNTFKQALFQPATYLRPRSVPEGNKLRFSPGNLSHGACTAFQEEGLVVVFGGNNTSESGGGMSQATNETWAYNVASKKWEGFNQIGEHEITDDIKARRHERGYTGDVFPAARCGHTTCGVRMVKDAAPISFTTAEGQVVAPQQQQQGGSNGAMAAAAKQRQGGLSKPSSAASGRGIHSASSGAGKGQQPIMSANFVDSTDANNTTTYRPTMIMFGGANLQMGTYYNDLWQFDVEARAWSSITSGGVKPTPRWQCVSGALEQRMFIFGGEGSNFQVLNDLHLYDHRTRMWVKLRTVEPVPPPRMMHAACTIGDKLVVLGGIGNSVRELSDTWILEMRTLLWRRVQGPAGPQARISPFYTQEAHVPVGLILQPHTIEGHVLIGFDDCVVLHGGKIGKNFNRFVWCLELSTGIWSIIGEVSTQENRSSPQGRWQHCACSYREVNATHTMSLAMSIDQYKDQRIHMTEDSETKVLINALSKRVARQMNFEGVLMTHGNKPVMSRTICGFIFGGSGYPRHFSDLWKVDVLDPDANQMYDLLTHGRVRHPEHQHPDGSIMIGGGAESPRGSSNASPGIMSAATTPGRGGSTMNLPGIPQASLLVDTDQLATNFFFDSLDEEGREGEAATMGGANGMNGATRLAGGKSSYAGIARRKSTVGGTKLPAMGKR